MSGPGQDRPALDHVRRLLGERRSAEAATAAAELVAAHPESVEAYALASLAEQQLGRFERMLAHAEHALSLAPGDFGRECRVLECRLYCGQAGVVLDRLRELEDAAGGDATRLARIAEYYTHCTRHADALRCYRRALESRPSDPGILFSLSASLIATGELGEAEATLTHVIELDPHDYDAYRNRATLRRWTCEDNHIDEMRLLLHEGVNRPAGEAQLCYALAKEYEDLGDDERAFDYLKRGADRRRGLMAYRVESDLDAIGKIIDVFDAALVGRTSPGCDEPGPVFVIGLPRSGTTLVDRILSSHPAVASLGEINDLAYALMASVAGGGRKLDLIERSAAVDFRALGERYVAATRAYRVDAPYLIDKTPLNYLYVGLIRLAMPAARIVHVERNPMDSCYGMYRTLFRAGYPFSYDFDDLARYYAAYRALMDHWRAVFDAPFLGVRYEALVDDQEGESRRIVDYCGLDWDPACLEFHNNRAPVATASSAQVRRPVYRDALGRWRRYERQLEPLREKLEAAGIRTTAA